MKPVIETHGLCKSYGGRTVVDHLDLTVPQGCVYGFLGPNGAGKSTTMKMLLGLVHPTGGSVELLGHTLNEENRIGLLRQTGSLIESPSGYLHLTARENLAIAADLKGVERRDIDRVLDVVHLTSAARSCSFWTSPPTGWTRRAFRRCAVSSPPCRRAPVPPCSSPATCWARWSRWCRRWAS